MVNVLLIVEGSEEAMLFDIVKEKGLNDKINLTIINAGSGSNIPIYYQDAISTGYYDYIFCVYDVDGKGTEQSSEFMTIKRGLFKILGDYAKVEECSFCTNPNILQIILLATNKLENVKLTNSSKKVNSDLVHSIWEKIGHKKHYDASSWQLDIIKNSIIYGPHSYDTLLENAKDLELDYINNMPGSNILKLLLFLKNNDNNFLK